MEIKHLLCINGHNERIWSVSWSPTEDLFATSSSDFKVKIWRLKKTEASREVNRCTMNKEECGGEYNYELECEIDDFFKKSPRSVKFSNDGKYLICASFDGTSSIWSKNCEPVSGPEDQVEGQKEKKWVCIATLEGHENEVKCASFDVSGNYIASCGRDKTIWIYEKSQEKKEEDYEDLNRLNSNLDYFCAAILTGHKQDVKHVCWSPIALLLASASYDNTIKIWTLKQNDWFCIQTLGLHTNTVWCLAFSRDGTRLASCSSDKNVFVYQSRLTVGLNGLLGKLLKSCKERLKLSTVLKNRCVVLNTSFPVPQLYQEVTLGKYGPILADDWEVNRAYEELHSRPIYGLDFDDYIITAGGDNKVKVIDLSDKFSNIYELDAHTADVNAVSWNRHRKEHIFASVGDDEYIRIWKLVK
ncbi:uncharacterized protein TOT_030000134 [Theileria orientalis strain Shintoku]|uniref:Probable cytosolic iron-sulfur protein assembly protein CIAO1 homolog n=1 Tax=Theileria orientalis strain Shintoku TaxID=869250 RepID=J4C8J0_THEOR|nr:uncharacterized protein TOT_030000134 [Theileria orientalis strain Shintoku]BAM40873.1 uncharacterized protein TOT_030000134 [Theileria orientalis strain Shintoku]|eukprot:XP_009691174.1 uncharacterized protein TOT_030000134 [Theileria orientalis strain Shintoku]